MTGSWLRFWQARSDRERWLLGIAAALLLATLLWFALIVPFNGALKEARTRHEAAVTAKARIAGKIALLAELEKRRPRDGAIALPQLALQSATEAGFTLSRNEPQADRRLNIAIPSARTPALYAWLAALEEQGVVVEQITLSRIEGQTVAVDAVLRVRS